jgi:hypothetical protein
MKRLALTVVVLALVPVTLGAAATAGTRGQGLTVTVIGGNEFIPNELVGNTFRFDPGEITAVSGATIMFIDSGNPAEPHTISVADLADLPDTFAESNACQGPGGFCRLTGQRHFSTQPPTRVLEDDADAEFGLDGKGDSLLMRPGGSISRVVTAPEGSTLYYLCVFHPWMQGRIDVVSR